MVSKGRPARMPVKSLTVVPEFPAYKVSSDLLKLLIPGLSTTIPSLFSVNFTPSLPRTFIVLLPLLRRIFFLLVR